MGKGYDVCVGSGGYYGWSVFGWSLVALILECNGTCTMFMRGRH
jgi:hypothetical protein